MATHQDTLLLSIVVPLYNESAGLQVFHDSLLIVAEKVANHNFEIIYCDDGSIDGTNQILQQLRSQHTQVKILALTRNFGKEIATSAGIQAANGQAILTIDADGQHPVELIPDFIAKWQAGSKVVVGLRASNQNEGLVKRYGSRLFYGLYSWFTRLKLKSGATDFRLIDRSVQQEFNRLTEKNRITRGLIDWLGYPQTYVTFNARPRLHGEAGYSVKKLFGLAINSMISLSISPLYLTAYIGVVILPASTLLGLGMLVNWLLGDPLNLNATGGAYMMVFMLFLIGILMVSQGIIGLYLSHIHAETQNRPLFVVDTERSAGVPGANGRT